MLTMRVIGSSPLGVVILFALKWDPISSHQASVINKWLMIKNQKSETNDFEFLRGFLQRLVDRLG